MNIFRKSNREKSNNTAKVEKQAEIRNKVNESVNDKQEKKEEFITTFDRYGRRVSIPKDVWKNNLLPSLIKAHWTNPTALYNDILSGVQNGLSNELKEAAEHLREIDPIKERAYTMLSITYVKCKLFDEAETALMEFINTYGKTGTIMTNLAKVYYGKDEKDKAEEVLLEGLKLDPNQSNGLPWYAAMQFEKLGNEGLMAAFNEIAEVKGSWLPQVLIAREYLKEKDIDKAKEQYENIKEIVSTNGSALATITNDLGRCGLGEEIVEYLEPIYQVKKHGIPTGINLINAYLMTKNIEKGEALLNELMKLEVPEVKGTLMNLSSQFIKLKAMQAQPMPAKDLKVEMIVLNKPVWYYGLENPKWLLEREVSNEKIVFIPYADIIKDNKEGKAHQLNEIGRFTRSIPLYIGENIIFNSHYDYNYVTPFAENFGPVVSKKPYTAEAIRDIAMKTGASYVVTGTLSTIYNCIEVINVIYDVKRDEFKKLEKLIERQSFGKDLNDMIDEIRTEFCGDNIDKTYYYSMPNPNEVQGYITALGQNLTQTLIQRKFLNKDKLNGERNILDWYLNLAIANSKNELSKFMLISGLAKSKEYGSEIYLEFKQQTLNLLLRDKENKTVNKLMPLVYKIYDMEKEYAESKAALSQDCNDPYYKEWLERI